MPSKLFGSPLIGVCARYGSIAGLLCGVFLISIFYMGKHPFLINPFFDFRVPVFAILLFFALKEVRDYHQDGVLSFSQGMAGNLFFLGTSAIMATLAILIFGTLNPAFLSEYISQFTKQIRNLPPEIVGQIGKEVLERNLDALPSTTLRNLAGLYAWQSFVIGFFISVIISVILRRQPKIE